jgi:hypothetical protein
MTTYHVVDTDTYLSVAQYNDYGDAMRKADVLTEIHGDIHIVMSDDEYCAI